MAKIIILAFLFIFLSTGHVVQSMDSCYCYSSSFDCGELGRSVILASEFCSSASIWRFEKNNLQTIPLGNPSTARDIDISFNDLGNGSPVPVAFYNLKALNLAHNSLKHLSFLSGSRVEKLIVADNEISDISEYHRITVTSQLIFSRNNITSLPANSFPIQGYPLNLIDISGNPITDVSEEAFEGLYVSKLFLNSTQLSSLPSGVFKDVAGLKHLSLKDNKLSNLSEDLFWTLDELETLELQENLLSELHESTFKSLVNLKKLYLDHNQLQTLPEGLFSRLHSLRDLIVRDNQLNAIPSLRECSGPIEFALFSGNNIANLGEKEIRSLLRSGFLYADLLNNPVERQSLQWLSNADDFEVQMSSAGDCGTIQFTVSDHGYVEFCITEK